MKTFRSTASLMSLVVVVATADVCSAKTCTWIGGSSGSFAAAENWSDSALPETGDTLVFTSETTITDSEKVNVGASGYIFDNSAKVTISLTGSGKVIKRGAGQLNANHPWTITGGVRVEAGTIFVDQLSGSEHNTSNPFGSGTVEITGTGCLDNTSWGRIFSMPIHITAFTGVNAISCGGPVIFTSPITSDSNFGIASGWAGIEVTGGISAPGKTVTLTLNGGTSTSKLGGTIDANIITCGSQTLNFIGSIVRANSTLNITKGIVNVASASSWSFPAVTVTGTNTKLVLPGAGKHTMASLAIGSDAKVDVSGGREMAIALSIGGTALADGDWTSSEYPANILTGTLQAKSTCKVWNGGSTNAWATASNWIPAGVPATGSHVIIPSAVSFTDSTIDIGADGMILECAALVNGKVIYNGSGRLVKRGAGRLEAEKAPWTLTGGILVEAGELYVNQIGNGSDPFGTGVITITAKGQLKTDSYGRNFKKDIVVSNFTGTTAINVNGLATFSGTVRSDSNFTAYSAWTDVYFNNIDAPGHVVTLDGKITVSGTFNGSLTKIGTNGGTFSGTGGAGGAKLTVSKGTLTFTNTGTWSGTDVTVDGSNARLQQNAKDRLAKTANVALKNGGKLIVPAGVRARVATLSVDGAPKDNGLYTKSNFANGMDGDGLLRIGDFGLCLIFR